MQKIFKRLEEIKKWVKESPDPHNFKTNDDFMRLWVELMNYAHYLLIVGLSSTKDDVVAKKGVAKHRAIVVGLMVRISKLYEGFIKQIADRQVELALIFVRLISETEVKIDYLINTKNRRKSSLSFILSAYKAEKEQLKDLTGKSKSRPLEIIEKRIMSTIKGKLKKDNITLKKLMSNKTWKLDGKDFKGILRSLNREMEYSYVFGNMSHFVHGTWHDLSIYHLESENGRYFPNLKYTIPDPRITGPITFLILTRLKAFLKWNKSDQDNYLMEIIESLLDLSIAYDEVYAKRRFKYYEKNV